jgi:hypothetical protein
MLFNSIFITECWVNEEFLATVDSNKALKTADRAIDHIVGPKETTQEMSHEKPAIDENAGKILEKLEQENGI